MENVRRRSEARGLIGETRGGVGQEYLLTAMLVGVLGIGGLAALGQSADVAIGGHGQGSGMALSSQAGTTELPPDADGSGAMSTASEAAQGEPSEIGSADSAKIGTGGKVRVSKHSKKKDCGLLCSVGHGFQKAGNFVTNMGLNPVQWVTDPAGTLQGAWNRLIGVGKFAWELGSGVVKLVHTTSTLFNPLYPGFWYDLATNGPKAFLERRLGVGKEFLRIAPGVIKLGWRTSPIGLMWDALAHPDEFAEHRRQDWNSLAHNPVTAAIVDPIAKCAGAKGSDTAEQACGKVLSDIALTIGTLGYGKAAKAAQAAEEVAAAEKAAAAAKVADEAAAAERAAAAARALEAERLAAAARAVEAERMAWVRRIGEASTREELEAAENGLKAAEKTIDKAGGAARSAETKEALAAARSKAERAIDLETTRLGSAAAAAEAERGAWIRRIAEASSAEEFEAAENGLKTVEHMIKEAGGPARAEQTSAALREARRAAKDAIDAESSKLAEAERAAAAERAAEEARSVLTRQLRQNTTAAHNITAEGKAAVHDLLAEEGYAERLLDNNVTIEITGSGSANGHAGVRLVRPEATAANPNPGLILEVSGGDYGLVRGGTMTKGKLDSLLRAAERAFKDADRYKTW